MPKLERAHRARRREPAKPAVRPVLVVEDDPGVRAFLTATLEHYGYRVVAAASGEEAIERLAGQSARLAVLDIGLPGMDGFDVADQLDPDVPVIIVTGDPVGAYARAHTGRHTYRVLPKPVAPDLLEHALSQVL